MLISIVLRLVELVSELSELLVTSDQGIVIGVAEPLIEGITVVRLTGSKLLMLLTLATNSSAGEAVILELKRGAKVVVIGESGIALDVDT